VPVTLITLPVSPYYAGVYDDRVGGRPLRIIFHGIVLELEKLAPLSLNIGPVDRFEGKVE
jgi:hypothetical protein